MIQVSALTDMAEIGSVAPEWRSLWQKAPDASGTQDYPYFAAAARRGGSAKASLRLIVARRGETLVGLWPLAFTRRGLCLEARELGCGNYEEYGGPLASPGDSQEVMEQMLHYLRGKVDVLFCDNISCTSAAQRALEGLSAPRITKDLHSPALSAISVAAYDDWLSQKSKSFREGLKRRCAQLQKLGGMSVTQVSDQAQAASTIRWIFSQKRHWLQQRGLKNPAFAPDRAEAHFLQLVAEPASPSVISVFETRVKGNLASAAICIDSADRVEYFVAAYDDDYDGSPGMPLIAACAQYASSLSKSLDFRLTRDSYKSRWADTEWPYQTHIVAFSPIGRLALALNGLQLASDKAMGSLVERLKAAATSDNIGAAMIKRLIAWRRKLLGR